MRKALNNELDNKISCGNNFSTIFTSKISCRETNIISFVNPFSYGQLKANHQLISNIDVFFSDGALLCMLHNIFCKTKIQRASFDYSSIASYVFDCAVQNNLPIAFVGAKQNELEGALANIKKRHVGIDIVYSHNGYFNGDDEIKACIKNLTENGARVVVVGMGTPYQENFSRIVKSQNSEGLLVLTCGGFLTQTSMRADYYYPFIKKTGLRWLQRMVMHKHVRQRVFKDYPKFLITYVYEHVVMAFSYKS